MKLKLTYCQYLIYNYAMLFKLVCDRHTKVKTYDLKILLDAYKYRIDTMERRCRYANKYRQVHYDEIQRMCKPIYVSVRVEKAQDIEEAIYYFMSFCTLEFDKYIIKDCKVIINKLGKLKV